MPELNAESMGVLVDERMGVLVDERMAAVNGWGRGGLMAEWTGIVGSKGMGELMP